MYSTHIYPLVHNSTTETYIKHEHTNRVEGMATTVYFHTVLLRGYKMSMLLKHYRWQIPLQKISVMNRIRLGRANTYQ